MLHARLFAYGLKKSDLGTSFQGRENERKAVNSRSVQQRSCNGLSGDAMESSSFFCYYDPNEILFCNRLSDRH